MFFVVAVLCFVYSLFPRENDEDVMVLRILCLLGAVLGLALAILG